MDKHECRCEAREDNECGCLGVDWSKVDREEIERLRAELATAKQHAKVLAASAALWIDDRGGPTQNETAAIKWVEENT